MMPTTTEIESYRELQNIAKCVLSELHSRIEQDDSERTLVQKASELLSDKGVSDTWYHGCPALVLLGSRNCLSISGKDYKPADERVGLHNLVTVDLSPRVGSIWGDCARSFYVENGCCTSTPSSPEFRDLQVFLAKLHRKLLEFVHFETTFAQLFEYVNELIDSSGFQNLDFLGNVGHSIATQLEDRRFIEQGNQGVLRSVSFFTFEPHIRKRNGRWSAKHENIYFFNDQGILEEL